MKTFLLTLLMGFSLNAAEMGLMLDPVLEVSNDGRNITILGNMPLPPSVPADKKQRNQVVYRTNIDDLGCKDLAQEAIDNGSSFVIIGNVGRRHADNGVFTMHLTSVSQCFIP